jgi:hypothetical protein
MRISRPHKWLRFFLRGVHMVQLNDVDKLKKNKMQDLPSSSGHKTILLLRPALGYRLLACSYWRQSWTRRHAPPPEISANLVHTSRISHLNSFLPWFLLFTSFCIWSNWFNEYTNVTRQQKGCDFGKVKIDGCCRAATPQFARTTTFEKCKMDFDGRGRSKVGTPLL